MQCLKRKMAALATWVVQRSYNCQRDPLSEFVAFQLQSFRSLEVAVQVPN
jgi:hypothetical protein